VTLRRSGSSHIGVVIRRGSSERTLAGGSLRLANGRGALSILVIGGASSAQSIRLVLSS
jgi:hypothetical protein